MTDLPEPMTPPDCDLRGYEYMPFVGQRVFGSTFYDLALRSPRAGLAGMKLWWEAYTQCPAGSLPDDEYALSRMADFGTDMKSWRACRDVALHGFVKCSDGRLYHPTIAVIAIKAFDLRVKADKKREADRERLRLWRLSREPETSADTSSESGGGTQETGDERQSETRLETSKETSLKRVSSEVEGKGREVKKEREGSELRSGAAPPPTDARTELFRDGKRIIRLLTGMSEQQSGAFLGKLIKALGGENCPVLLGILREAEDLRPADPRGWLVAAATHRRAGKPGAMDKIRADWDLPELQWHSAPSPDDTERLPH